MNPGYYAEFNVTGFEINTKNSERAVEVSFTWITFSNMESKTKHVTKGENKISNQKN